jgi:hypothetical protein
MGSIDRHIFRTTLASFALVRVSLTGVIRIVQALRGIEPPAALTDAIGRRNARLSRLFGRPATT